jgi:hypothetical protein
MISFKTFYTEAKQVGILYHYTTLERLALILESNILRGKPDAHHTISKYVSFTRDKHFHRGARDSYIKKECRLVIDGDKLSHHYKTQPYNYYNPKDYVNKPHQGAYDETEERITGIIKDIKKYVIKVQLFENAILYYEITNNNTLDINGKSYSTIEDYIDYLKQFGVKVELI